MGAALSSIVFQPPVGTYTRSSKVLRIKTASDREVPAVFINRE